MLERKSTLQWKARFITVAPTVAIRQRAYVTAAAWGGFISCDSCCLIYSIAQRKLNILACTLCISCINSLIPAASSSAVYYETFMGGAWPPRNMKMLQALKGLYFSSMTVWKAFRFISDGEL